MASITITVPNAAVPFIREVCIADGWDQATPPTLAEAVEKQIIQYYRERIIQIKVEKSQRQIQSANAVAIQEADAVLGL